MSTTNLRLTVLERLYHQYLDQEHSAAFIRAVSSRYTVSTLQRICENGGRNIRRAAALALGFLAGMESNHTLGRALHDRDRGVRMLAETGLRAIWQRGYSAAHARKLAEVVRRIAARELLAAIDRSTQLIEEAPAWAEAWHQRGVAYFHLDRFEEAADDFHQTLELNAYHFPAAVGMGNCYLELDDAPSALESFRRALKLNPDLEGVRTQIGYLRQILDEK